MNYFKYTKTTSDSVIVEGTDVHGVFNKTIVDGTQWFSIKQVEKQINIASRFDNAVLDFFQPLTDAIEDLTEPEVADFATYTIEPGVEAQEEVLPLQYELDKNSQILRAIEAELFDLLVWVNDDLVVLQP